MLAKKIVDISPDLLYDRYMVVDFQTLEDDTVTARDRDTAKQERVNIDEVQSFLKEKVK